MPPSRLNVKEFIDAGMRISQVEGAIDVLKAVCDALYPNTDPREGILATKLCHPKLIDRDEGIWVTGLQFMEVDSLEEELSKREREAPLRGKVSIGINRRSGIVLLNDRSRSFLPTRKEFEFLEFLRERDKGRLKEISKSLKMTEQNTSAVRRELNKKFNAKVNSELELIKHSSVEGYFLNTDFLSILWE